MNLIVYNLQEDTSLRREQKEEDDPLRIRELCDVLRLENHRDITISELTRLGKIPSEPVLAEKKKADQAMTESTDRSGKTADPRPLRITFADCGSKKKFLRNLYRLSKAPDNLKKIGITKNTKQGTRHRSKKSER